MTNNAPTSIEREFPAATTLVVSGNGKTGRRVVQRLQALGHSVRIGSRSGSPAFDWTDRTTWAPALAGVASTYIAYPFDLAAPGAAADIQEFADLARREGVRRLVLLSGRGEPEARRCEQIVETSGLAWTIVRCSWFNQNFSEGFFRNMLLGGALALPVGGVREPFVDADDIADVAVAALTSDRHDGQLYELTGPELFTFAEATATIGRATGRNMQFVPIPHDAFLDGMRAQQFPREIIELCDYLFAEVLDGRNSSLGDGVRRAIGRESRSFADYAHDAAAAGSWNA